VRIGDVGLYRWYNPTTGDWYTTTDPAWAGREGDVRNGYQCQGTLGYVYAPGVPQDMLHGMMPLYNWYNATTSTHYLTSDPAWAGAPGSTRAGYQFLRMEGYIALGVTFNYDANPMSAPLASGITDEGVAVWHVTSPAANYPAIPKLFPPSGLDGAPAGTNALWSAAEGEIHPVWSDGTSTITIRLQSASVTEPYVRVTFGAGIDFSGFVR